MPEGFCCCSATDFSVSMAYQQPQTTDLVLLFVDDEQNILSSLKRLFRPLKYTVLTAGSGSEGLKLLGENHVDLVMSDMRMPEMDGAEFLAHVAEQWPQVVRILLTGYSDLNSTIKAVNEGAIYKYISKPWEDNDIKLTVRLALEKKALEAERNHLLEITKKQNDELSDLNANLEKKVVQRTAQLKTAHERLRKNYFSAIQSFSSLIGLREGCAASHAKQVAELACQVGEKMGMDPESRQQLLFAGLLHDIGKIGLPDTLINKPYHTLAGEERRQVASHAVVGEALLMGFEPLNEAAAFIRSHHEYVDGSGYPDGLAGDDIPLAAKILTVVNDYEALQNGSLYPQRLSTAEAREFLLKHKGQRYDGTVVDAFLALFSTPRPEVIKDEAIKVSLADLKEGMVLARDMYTKSGILVLSEGHVLDDKLVQKIVQFVGCSGEALDVFIRGALATKAPSA